jgi:hypothetical protein
MVLLGIAFGALNGAQAQTLEQKIVARAQQKLNKRIGDGQCTSFVSEVLAEVNAQPVAPTKSVVVENGKVKKIDSYAWGTQIISLGKRRPPVSPKPGNILQFENCVINNGYSTWTLGSPHHTSIVVRAEGRKVTVLHQNMEGDLSKSHVREDTFDLAGLKSGSYRVYAAVPKR